jgi:hypothetical protein
MAEFRYDRSFNAPAWVGSIADIIRRQGEIPAEAALRIGQIQGQGAQQSGLAYAAALNHVGGDVSNALLQATDPRRKLDDMRLRQAQQLEQGQGVVDQALTPYQPSGPQPEGAGPAPAQHPYLDAQGLYDIPKLSDVLASSGMAHLTPDLLKGAESINESILQHQKRQADLGAAETVMYGDMADGVQKLVKGGLPFDQALDLAAAPGLATQRFDPQQFAKIKAQLVNLPPEQQDAALNSLKDAASKASGPKTLAEGATEVGRYGDVLASNPKPVPVEKPTEASIALAAAGGDPVAAAAMDRLKPTPEKAPHSIDEQLLEAIASGDTQKRDQIIATKQAAAAASRDPVALAQLSEARNLNQQAAQARLDALKEKNKPLDIAPDIQTSRTGHQFVDLSLYGVGERDRAREAANKAGAIPVSKETASGLQDLDTARANQADILAQIQDLLPKTTVGRLGSKLTVPLERIFQTNDQIAAFNTWRTSAIQTMRATAGSKGLRINRSEIDMAIQNDIPNLTDTLGTAQQKIANINKMLDNIENSSLVRDRSALVPEKPPTGPPEPASLSAPPGIQSLRNRK